MMNLAHLSSDQLRAEIVKLAHQERQATAALIRCLMEVDTRRLYLVDGYSSLFTFCTQVLHLSEHAALGRIEVARAAKRLPRLLCHLEDGSITVTNARMLAPHLTDANCDELLASARHRSKREVEEIVATLRPQPDVRSAVRKLPSPPASEEAPVAASRESPAALRHDEPPSNVTPHIPARPVIAPLARERYKIQFTASKETLDKLRYAQDLLRHTTASGDVAVVFERALSALIEQLEKQKCGLTTRPRNTAACAPGSRHIPASVRREVWQRDGGRCAFVGTRGRCNERAFLEFHHLVPFAAGGRADPSNIQLRCRAHNLYEADLFFGADVVRESAGQWGCPGILNCNDSVQGKNDIAGVTTVRPASAFVANEIVVTRSVRAERRLRETVAAGGLCRPRWHDAQRCTLRLATVCCRTGMNHTGRLPRQLAPTNRRPVV
jgi:5-methylcytosine-specific restriction endonuclease McrA